MDNFETILQVFLVIVFFFGKFILRLLVGGKKRVQKRPASQKKPDRPVAARPVSVQKPISHVQKKVAQVSTYLRRQPQKQLAAPSVARQAGVALASLEILKQRASAIANTCAVRGFYVLQARLLAYDTQIRALIVQFGDTTDSKAMNSTAVDSFNNAVQVIDARLGVFEAVLKERSASLGDHYNAADRILSDMIATCQKRHRGGQSFYQYVFGGVVHSPGSLSGGLHGVTVSQSDVAQFTRWGNIAFHLHLAISKKGKFAIKIAGDMGLPQATVSMSYFLSTGRLMSAGLVSSWINWIYADVAATLQLGEAYATSLLTQCERHEQPEELTQFAIDSKSRVIWMPMIPRLIVVHAVLQKMAMPDLEAFADRVSALIEQYPLLVLEVQGTRQLPIPSAEIFGDLFQVAFSLVDTPLSVLDNFSPEEIFGSDFGTAQSKRLAGMADTLAAGKPLTDARPIKLFLAGYWAQKQTPNNERLIESALLKSLKKQAVVDEFATSLLSPKTVSPQKLKDVFSAEFLPQTIMIGALSKTRGGISSRR